MKIFVINGPNINMLGVRETEKYGSKKIDDINGELIELAKELDVEVDFYQSNIEGEIVTEIQRSMNEFDGIIINPAAYTHTSIAIRDAILAVKLPCIEVHLSNIHTREDFRQKSYIAPVCIGQISGFKENSYKLALRGIVNFIEQNKK